MKEELAALKKKRDAGDITAFKFRQGERRIKKKYGIDAPSNVGKIVDFISSKVGPAMTAKGGAKGAAAKKKAAEQTARSDRQLIKKAKTAEARKTPRDAPKKSPPKKRAAPKFNPSGLKVPAKKKAAPKKEKMYTAINTKTGKADFDKPKVTAAQRLKQEDRYKAYKRITTAAKESMKKKKRG
jgi:hypothetical protein